MRILSRFIQSKSGNFALIMAICAPVLFGMGGLATDYAQLYNKRADLQNLADAAALASTQELQIANMNDAEIKAVAEHYALANSAQPVDDGRSTMTIESSVNANRDGVIVKLSYEWTPFFAQLFDPGVTPIIVKAEARLAGEGLSCVIGMMEPQTKAKSSIHLENNSVLSAPDCAVYANTVHPWALRLDGKAQLSARSICSAGGVLKFGFGIKITPEPITDCPLAADPLGSRPAPSFAGCDETNYVVSGNETIRPGVYCGGLTVAAGNHATMQPGIYVISGGKLRVEDGATLSGTGVGFFLTGGGSLIDFLPESTIDLAAPETGALAGLLFYEDRNVPYSFDFNPLDLNNIPAAVRVHRIRSNHAHNLLGTIYLLRSVLLIDSNAPVADASAYTAIVTGRLWLQAGPKLVLNAEYANTKVPVPGGLLGTTPRLVN
ncbi:MAG: pilus assembly protein TadG-related protein [Nitratireductor sp.]